MLKKRIANIVFYKTDGSESNKQATIFYKDGTIRTVSFDEGIDACEEIVKERHIQTKDAFKEMINRDVVHVVSLKDFKENFNSYLPTEISREEEVVDPKEELASKDGDIDHEVIEEEPKEEKKEEVKVEAAAPVVAAAVTPKEEKKEEPKKEESKKDDGLYHFTDEEEKDVPEEKKENEDPFDGSNDFDSSIEDEDEKEEPKEEKQGFFSRLWTKIKKNKVVKRVLLCVTALAVALGIYSCSQRKTLEGAMNRSNLTNASTVDNNVNADDGFVVLSDDTVLSDQSKLQAKDIHYYEDSAIKALLNRTHNATQKTAMSNLGEAMDGFNNTFAAYYLEEGKDVRPALKFDEVVALQVAYNDYSKDQLAAYFNGADVRSADLTRAYKDANLQLMGAYAIENSKHPVDMSMLIESQEGKDFYQRYHQAFLAAKEATGDDKLRLVSDFYQMVHEDFPITEEVRTEGISHSANYESLEAYKLAVTPMIAAGEMMWQNLETDITLNDSEIDFLNDLGLCNYADKSFERAETVALSSQTDKNNPTFQEYKDAYVKYYIANGIYYIDDAHRELTELQSFQDAVNWHFAPEGEWSYQGGTSTTTETHTEEHHWTETETTYHEETTTTEVSEDEVPEELREGLQDQVDAQLEAENERRRREAEEAAERERQRLQAEEDAHAQQVEEEVRRDDEDLQQHIEDANEQIDHNHEDTDPTNDKPVNESDLGHGVDFDDQHSDGQGNLDPSVEHITTDPTGDMTDQPLPDPNETGRDFDAAGNNSYSAPVTTESTSTGWVESVPVDDDYYFEDAWVEYDEPINNATAVDSYVESLATGEEAEEGYQYSK